MVLLFFFFFCSGGFSVVSSRRFFYEKMHFKNFKTLFLGARRAVVCVLALVVLLSGVSIPAYAEFGGTDSTNLANLTTYTRSIWDYIRVTLQSHLSNIYSRLGTMVTHLQSIANDASASASRLLDISNRITTLTNGVFSRMDSILEAIGGVSPQIVLDEPFVFSSRTFDTFLYYSNGWLSGTFNGENYFVDSFSASSVKSIQWNSRPVTDGVAPVLMSGVPYFFELVFPGSYSGELSNISCTVGSTAVEAQNATISLSDTKGSESSVGYQCVLSFIFTPDKTLALDSFYFWLGGDLSFTVVPGGYIRSSIVQAPISFLLENQSSDFQNTIESQFDTSQGSEVGSAAQDFAEQASESLGVVSYVDTLFSGLSGLVTAGSTTLTFPAFAIAVQGTDYQVWQEHTFDLSQLDGWFSGLMAAVRLATSVVVVGAVIHYLQSVYKDVIG